MVVTPSFRVMPNPYGAFVDARNSAQDRAQQQREIQYRDTQRQGAQAYGQHVAGGDYESAATVAGKLGDAEGAIEAREMGREELFMTAQRYNERLATIASMSDPRQQYEAYRAYYNDALTEAQRTTHRGASILTPEARAAFDAETPAPAWENWETIRARLPEMAAAGRQRLISQAQQGLTRSQWAENETAREAAIYEASQDERRFQQTERRLDQGDARLAAAIARGNGGGGPPSGYRWTPDGNLQAIPGGPGANAGGAMSDGQRVASASAVRMQTAETTLQALEGTNPSEWANALEALPVFGESQSAGARTSNQRALDQASNQWAEAFLRATSGAAVTADEIRRVERIFMPRPGDGPAELSRKREARRVAQEAIEMGLPERALSAISVVSGGGGGGGDPQRPANVPSNYVLLRDANGNPTGWGPP